MPNYASLEKDALSAEQRGMAAQARRPAVTRLGDAELLALIRSLLGAASTASDQPGADGSKSPRQLLTAALRRATNERRRRGLTARGAARRTTEGTGEAGSAPAAIPVDAAPHAMPGLSAARAKGARKSKTKSARDPRPEARRIAKPKGKPSGNAKPAISAVPVTPMPVTPTAATPVSAAAEDRPRPTKKAVRKAEKQAAKEERKAAKKAEKAARKDAKAAARDAEKKARKAARKSLDEKAKSTKTAEAKTGKKDRSLAKGGKKKG